MRLTLHTDYALRVMIFLTQHPDRLCSISEIARAYGISQNHLMKVAHALVKAEFVASVRGRNGGLRLARPAQDISVGVVVRQMEDGFDLVDCSVCVVARGCGLRGLLGKATGAFLAVLDSCSLADLDHGSGLFDFMFPGQHDQDTEAATER